MDALRFRAPDDHPSQPVADLPGFLSADEVGERYQEVSGRHTDALDFYIVLAAFKLTIIGEGIRARARRNGVETASGGLSGIPLADWALDRADRSAMSALH